MRRRAFDPFESMRRHIESFFDDDLFDFDDDPFFQMPMHSFFRFGPSPRPSRRVPPAARASNAREIPITFADSPELHQRSGRPPLIEEIPLDEGEHHNPVRRRSIVSVEEPEEVDAEEPEEPIEYVPRTHYSSSTVMSYADSSGRATTVSSETRMAPDGHLETRRRVRETNGEDKETFERARPGTLRPPMSSSRAQLTGETPASSSRLSVGRGASSSPSLRRFK
ncbi:Uncharacterized protein PBTT_02998 [Plasmodiophora brassicae]|uniref:Uncharacterized protein n=1 Tax=Plasmodiophora brassicae TaxID=37360 RepID=A0A3P3Y5V2_PLABS|nr:unnamed protein product [Plasmodiophora brassicae]